MGNRLRVCYPNNLDTANWTLTDNWERPGRKGKLIVSFLCQTGRFHFTTSATTLAFSKIYSW